MPTARPSTSPPTVADLAVRFEQLERTVVAGAETLGELAETVLELVTRADLSDAKHDELDGKLRDLATKVVKVRDEVRLARLSRGADGSSPSPTSDGPGQAPVDHCDSL